ncbi:MAG: methionine adenosyltransferase [Gemmatimonadota bacterium]
MTNTEVLPRRGNQLFTSESVTEGHPDKVCDQISDAVLDSLLSVDPGARVACETMVTTGFVMIAGEITASPEALKATDYEAIARETLREIGYDEPDAGLDYRTCEVLVRLDRQSADISRGVDTGGAGDQGMMFGYASDETANRMPLAIELAHRMTERLSRVRKDAVLGWLRPDGKSQVTVEYEDGRPVRVPTVVMSAQHSPDVEHEEIQEELIRHVTTPVLASAGLTNGAVEYHINPTGRFEIGGPQGDAGLTGRKIIVDTYGGMGSHGGGAFSGKDPSKVDRSACYAARWVAKNLVEAELVREVEIQLAYAIGVAEPVSVMVDSFGTGEIPDADLVQAVRRVFDLRPKAIIDDLGLCRPIYRRTAAYGHFGRDPEPDGGFSWEKTDRAAQLRSVV